MVQQENSREQQVLEKAESARRETLLAVDALEEALFDSYERHMEKAMADVRKARAQAGKLAEVPMTQGCVEALIRVAMAELAVEHAGGTKRLYHRVHDLECRVRELECGNRRPVRVLLVCANGISTSMLINKMQEHVAPGDVVEAASIFHVGNKIDKFDVVLLGPHMKPQAPIVKNLCKMKNKPFAMIDSMVYGKLDGKAVLEQARSLV